AKRSNPSCCARASIKSLMLMCEDLYWSDGETQVVLSVLNLAPRRRATAPSSPHLTVRLRLSAGCVVPTASHTAVASYARVGRLPLAKQRAPSQQDSYSCDLMSHACAVLLALAGRESSDPAAVCGDAG